MIKSSSDNYSKSSVECLVIGLCNYIVITFHNNLTEAKIAERIDHFTVACSVAWPLNGSEAGGDLVLIQTSLLLLCK